MITPPSNPAKIARIQDLANPGVQLEIAAAGVPVGDYAREALKNAGILSGALANVVSNAQDDASLVQAIATNSADAAIVYTSDVTKAVAPSIHVVQIPAADNVTAVYPAAAVQGSPNIALAQQFVNYLDSDPGKATLRGSGFLPPPTH
jgi:molybdate transport system substrate-binding protein